MNRALAKKNPMCDQQDCVEPSGEVRKLPYPGGGKAIICRHCYDVMVESERLGYVTRGGTPHEYPSWESLEVYTGTA